MKTESAAQVAIRKIELARDLTTEVLATLDRSTTVCKTCSHASTNSPKEHRVSNTLMGMADKFEKAISELRQLDGSR